MSEIQNDSQLPVVEANSDQPANLILSRRENQTLMIRPLGIPSAFDIAITVVETRSEKARVGIRCLREISILRSEIEDDPAELKPSRLGKVVETLRRLLTGEISQLRAMRIANDLKLWSLPRVELEITNTDLME